MKDFLINVGVGLLTFLVIGGIVVGVCSGVLSWFPLVGLPIGVLYIVGKIIREVMKEI